MMSFPAALYLVVSHWTRHKSDAGESPSDRALRLMTVSQSVAVVCDRAACFGEASECRPIYRDRAECAAGLLVLAGDIESGFAAHVHRGECARHECDQGHAVGLWQTHRLGAWTDPQWAGMQGDSLEATTATAAVTARFLAGGVGRCGSLAGSFGLYQSGHRCNAYIYEQSAKHAVVVAAQIRVLLARPEP